MACEIVPAELAHITAMSGRFRGADVAEAQAVGNESVESALAIGLRESHIAATVLIDGQPVAMFGVNRMDLSSGIGVPWMFGTSDLLKHHRLVLTEGRRIVDLLMQHHTRLVNFVDARNHAAVRWLLKLGFTIYEPIPYGSRGELFHPFEMR